MKKKILVTGGNGFIGGHVVDNLVNKGYEVTSFDRDIKKLAQRELVNMFVGDIKDKEAVMTAVGNHDGVIHLAGRLGTCETINNPIPSVEVNTIGSLNVFHAVKEHKVPAVYISVGNWWMNNSYSISKNAAERLALMYNKEHGTRIAVVRGLNAYGPRQKYHPVKKIVPTFILTSLKKKPIKVYGDGTQIMDMIWVKDLAEILVRALTMDHGAYDLVMDAGPGIETSVNDIANLVNKITGNTARINHVPMRAGEPEGSVVLADPKTLSPLEFTDFMPLKDGLEKAVEWYREATAE